MAIYKLCWSILCIDLAVQILVQDYSRCLQGCFLMRLSFELVD